MVTSTLTETLRDAIVLTKSTQLFHPVPHVATVWRWATKGTRGVILQTWMRGGQRVTTPAAVEAFLIALNASHETTSATGSGFSVQAKAEQAALKAVLG